MEIIVASSNLFRRELSCFILSEAGYHVYEAKDSVTLLKYLDKMTPAVILLDARLNGMPNDELTTHIRAKDANVPIMVLTNGSSLISSMSIAANGDAQLDWPYQAEDLLSRVQVLQHRFSRSTSQSVSSHVAA
jgi:DNA-binding response OmpR family regulator